MKKGAIRIVPHHKLIQAQRHIGASRLIPEISTEVKHGHLVIRMKMNVMEEVAS